MGGARSQGKGRKVNTGLRGLAPCTGFPLNFRTPPLLGAIFFLFLLGASDTRIRTCYEYTPCPHEVPVLLDDNTRIRSLEVADAYKEKKQQAKFRRLKRKGRALLIGKAKLE